MKLKTGKTKEKITETKAGSLKSNKLDNPLARLTKKKKKQQHKLLIGAITTNPIDSKGII